MRVETLTDLLMKYGYSADQVRIRIEACKEKLKVAAKDRVKPGLDDKSITSWNALMIKGFADAYATFGNVVYKETAIKCMDFILNNQLNSSGELLRIYKNGNSKIEAFLDDYAFTIDALLSVYTISKNEYYLTKANGLTSYVIENFSLSDGLLFYYTNSKYHQLITQQTETSDNVIPSSNSQMAINLFNLGRLLDLPDYSKRAHQMLQLFLAEMTGYAAGYSNWGCLALHFVKPFNELVIVGKHVDEIFLGLHKHYFTNTILVVSENDSSLPLLKNRWKENETLIYVCRNNTCGLPTTQVNEALKTLEKV